MSGRFNPGLPGLRSQPWLRRSESRNPMLPTSAQADTGRIRGTGRSWQDLWESQVRLAPLLNVEGERDAVRDARFRCRDGHARLSHRRSRIMIASAPAPSTARCHPQRQNRRVHPLHPAPRAPYACGDRQANPPPNRRHQPVVVDPIKELFQIQVHHPAVSFGDILLRLGYRLMRRALRTKAVTLFGERPVPPALSSPLHREFSGGGTLISPMVPIPAVCEKSFQKDCFLFCSFSRHNREGIWAWM